MRPEPDNLDGLNISHHLIHKTMLDIDAPGISAGQIADEFLKWGRVLKRGLSPISREAVLPVVSNQKPGASLHLSGLAW
jgi:hypothetical protein